MPKLIAYTQFRQVNFFDAIRLNDVTQRQELVSGRMYLFGNRHIGIPHLCNLLAAGQLGTPEDGFVAMAVQNIYARTNVPADCDGFREWTEATQVTFTVGYHPAISRPLADWLRIGPGEYVEPDKLGMSDHAIAAQLYGYHRIRQGLTENPMEEAVEREWLTIAREARQLLKAPEFIVVPVRQTCGFVVTAEPSSTMKYPATLSSSIAPEPLVWMHIEGYARRDAI